MHFEFDFAGEKCGARNFVLQVFTNFWFRCELFPVIVVSKKMERDVIFCFGAPAQLKAKLSWCLAENSDSPEAWN